MSTRDSGLLTQHLRLELSIILIQILKINIQKLYQYNEDDFRSKFLIYIKLLNSMDTHKKEKLSIKKSFSLIICKLVIRKQLVNNQNKYKKSS